MTRDNSAEAGIATPEELRLSVDDLSIAATIVESPTVIGQYASCEWDCLDENGQLWVSAIVRAARAWDRPADTIMAEALRQCRDQFAFYGREHRAACKDEKAATNERFAKIAADALARHRLTFSAEQNTGLRLAAVSEAAPVSGGEMLGREVLGPHATIIDEDGEDGFKPVAALVGSIVCVEQAGHMIAMSRATARKLVEVLSEGLGDAEQLAFERQERADWGDLHRLQQRGPNLVKPRLGGNIVRWAADEIAALRSAR